MKWITARRRHPLAGYAVVILALALFGAGYAALAPTSDQAQAQILAASPAQDDREVDVAEGKRLFDQTCASCHGLDGSGTANGPDLREVGGAAINFQVSTGRMPSMDPDVQMPRKDPVMSPAQIDDLVAYYEAFLAEGRVGAPVPEDVPGAPPQRADFESEEEHEEALEAYYAEYNAYIAGEGLDEGLDTDMGMKLYLTNCAHCHSWSGGGGALTDGRWAPEIHDATPRQIYEAMVSGPGAMPMFSDGVITPDEKQQLISYVKTLHHEPDAGGIFNLNRIGQAAEGFVAWTIGISLIIACAIWITAKQRAHD